MIVVQPDVKTVFGEIRRILRQQARVVVLGFANQNPADVRPPRAVIRGMRIAFLIRLLMMNPVSGYPKDGAAFERGSAADGKKVFERLRNTKRTVGMKTVITQTDTEPHGQPIQEQGYAEGLPTEHKERTDGTNVQDGHYDSGGPVQALLLGGIGERSGGHVNHGSLFDANKKRLFAL